MTTIPNLPVAAALTGAELVELSQGGVSVKAPLSTVSGTAFFEGDYSGGVPPFTPSSTAIAFDTLTGTQWNFYAGNWH